MISEKSPERYAPSSLEEALAAANPGHSQGAIRVVRSCPNGEYLAIQVNDCEPLILKAHTPVGLENGVGVELTGYWVAGGMYVPTQWVPLC